eukprot:2507924-Rhodomonas_salina.1
MITGRHVISTRAQPQARLGPTPKVTVKVEFAGGLRRFYSNGRAPPLLLLSSSSSTHYTHILSSPTPHALSSSSLSSSPLLPRARSHRGRGVGGGGGRPQCRFVIPPDSTLSPTSVPDIAWPTGFVDGGVLVGVPRQADGAKTLPYNVDLVAAQPALVPHSA